MGQDSDDCRGKTVEPRSNREGRDFRPKDIELLKY